METALLELAAIIAVMFVIIAIPLAIFATGIRSQERAGSLASQPRGICAALTSRVLDLHTARTPTPGPSRPVRRETPLTTSRQEAQQS